jgi:hypothetical protein
LEELLKLSPEERMLVQWRTSFGCPVSDESKAQFSLECLGHQFTLADVRLWLEKHPQKGKKEQNTRQVHLEFFFDGMLSEIQDDPSAFEKAFEEMIEFQLQEKRRSEFRKKLETRKRRKDVLQVNAEDAEGGTSAIGCPADDSEWQAFLHKPVLPTELSIHARREAGCMLRFIVCQTSVSVSASEELGQIAFPEHFPIDGKPQEIALSSKPLPKWVYVAGTFSALFTLLTIVIFWQVFKGVFAHPSNSTALL